MLFDRVPKFSKPFVYAALLDTVGFGLLLGAIQPFAGVMARRLGAGPVLLGFLAVAQFLGFISSSMVSRLLFRYQWGRLIGLFRLLGRCGVILMSVVNTPLAFVSILVFLKATTSWGKIVFQSLMRCHVRSRVRPNVMKWVRAMGMLISVPVAWLVGNLLDLYPGSYRVIFPVAGLLAVLSSVFFFKVPRSQAERRAHETSCGFFDEIKLLVADRRFLWFMLALFIGGFGEKIVMPINPIYFADVLQLKYSDVGLTLGVVGPLLSVCGFFFWGKCAGRFSPLKVLIVCMFIKTLKPVLWALASVEGFPVMPCLLSGAAIFRFMIAGMEIGSVLSVLNMSRGNSAHLYVGIHYLLLGIRGLLGPTLGVVLYKAGMEPQQIYWLVAAVVLAGGSALLIFKAVDSS
ncbi:MAG: MFS transporter [Verrucomicrobiota bacterium]